MNTLTPAQTKLVEEFQKLAEWLDTAKKRAEVLRRQLAEGLFPEPKEGTNTLEVGNLTIKLVHKINRTLDESSLAAVMPQMDPQYRGIGPDCLIDYKPKFSLDAFRKLPDDQRLIFEQALVVKEGLPVLEFITKEEAAPATEPKTDKKFTKRKGVK